jgi:hypothetical protein
VTAPHALDEALALAREQLARLQRGDTEGYIAGLAAYGDACALLDAGVPAGRHADFATLVALDAEMAILLAHSRDALQAELAPISHRRRIAGAYFPSSGARGTTIANA